MLSFSGHASDPSAAYTAVNIGGMCCLFIAEIVVQIYTWRSTWKVLQEVKKLRVRKSLLFFLLRDGELEVSSGR